MNNLIKVGGGNSFPYYFLDVSTALVDDYSRTIKNLSGAGCYAMVSTLQKVTASSYLLNTVTVDDVVVPASGSAQASNGYKCGSFISKIKSTSNIVIAGHESYGAEELVMLSQTKPNILDTVIAYKVVTTVSFSSSKNIMIIGLCYDAGITSTTFTITCDKEVIFYQLETTYCIAVIQGNGLKTGAVTSNIAGGTTSIHIYEF